MKLFKVVTGEKDADATDPEVFSGPATNPSLRSPWRHEHPFLRSPDTEKEAKALSEPLKPVSDPEDGGMGHVDPHDPSGGSPSLKNGAVEDGLTPPRALVQATSLAMNGGIGTPPPKNAIFPRSWNRVRLFKVVTGEGDADATDPEVFSGPATKPSLEKPLEARTSISEVPDTGKEEKSTPGHLRRQWRVGRSGSMTRLSIRCSSAWRS